MKKISLAGIASAAFIICSFLILSSCSTTPEQAAINSFKDKPFVIKRGVNISHWLSQSRQRGEQRLKWFTKSDVDFIAAQHFDHIRLPIDEEQMWDSTGTRSRKLFSFSITV